MARYIRRVDGHVLQRAEDAAFSALVFDALRQHKKFAIAARCHIFSLEIGHVSL